MYIHIYTHACMHIDIYIYVYSKAGRPRRLVAHLAMERLRSLNKRTTIVAGLGNALEFILRI